MAGEATLQITLNRGIQTSNFSRDSFVVENTGTKTISEITIDVTSAIFPDMVFDPFGVAGDSTNKELTIDTNGGTGVVTPSTASYIGSGGIDGFTGIVLTFDLDTNSGFEPGETLGFSVDMDPNSIAGSEKIPLDNGSSPSWDVGGVSGAELIGSTFTVTFSDETTASGQLQGVVDSATTEEQGGAQALASQDITESSVALTVNGLAAGGTGTYAPGDVTVVVNGVSGETARIVLAKGFIQPGENLFAEPYRSQLEAQLNAVAASDFPANNAVEFQVVDVLLTGSPQDITFLFNFNSIPIVGVDDPDTLPLGFVASVIDPTRDGLATGPVTTPIYLKSENRTPTPSDDAVGTTGDPVLVDVLANDSDPDGDTLALVSFTQGADGTVTRDDNGTPADLTDDRLLYTPGAGFAGSDSFSYTVEDPSGETQSATVNVDDGSVPAFELNINAGGGDYTALDGTLFVADTQFFSGNAVTGGTPVAGTEDDVLFQSWRSGNFSYDITVANGLYAIELGFSEAFRSGAGERLFDVTIEDTVALDNFDIFATTGAQDTAYITPTILANVSDGTLNIDFEKVLRNPVVQSISVRSVTAEGAPPDAVDNGYTVDEDGTLVVDALTGLLANDSDPDGDTLTAELAVGPANGSVTVNADGSFSYIPDPDFAGSDSFTYTATDIAGFSDVATVNITVNPLNDTPTPSDDAVGTTGDPVLVDVLANDSDPDGDTLALVSFTQGADGTVTRDDNGTPADLTDDRLLYTPGAGFAGSDSFSYTVEDPSGETQSATVNVDDGSVPAFELNINAGGGDYTALDGTLFVADTQFFSGNAVTGGTPVAGTEDDVLFQSWRSGNFSYDITVANGLYAIELGFSEAFRSGAGERLFDVTIEDTVALDNFDIFATTGAQDTAYITPTILANVSDGTLNIDFEKVLRNPVVQSISVRSVTAEGAPPDAVDNGYTVDEDGTLVVDALTGLLANDSDPDGDTLTAELAVGPANGSVTVNADGSFSYIPDPDFAGSDSFTYTATDIAGFSDVATVNITVNPLNDTPTPSDDAVGTTGDPVLVDVLANDSDPDGDTLALVSFTQGADGTVTRDDNGTPADLTDDRLLYTPGAGFAGSDSFSYTVEDPSGETQSATVNVDDGSVPAFELNINAGGGDYTALDGTLFVADTQFFSGNAVTGGTPVAGTEDDVLFQSWRSGNFSYDITVANGLYAIELGFSEAFRSGAGERLFDVTIEDTVALDNFDIFATTGAQDTAYITPTILANVSDGTLNIDFEKVLRNPVVQSISVRSVTAEGAPPDAVDNGYTVDEDGTLVVDALTGLLANDSDPDGDTLTAELAVGPANGSVTVNADGSFSYIPDPDFAGSDSFTYTATDIAGFSDVATVNITVNPLNDTPTPSDDAVGTTGDPVLVDVLANDSDPDGDTLALVSFTQGADGTVTRDDNGTPADLTDDRLLYTPGAGFAGSDSFSYTVEDPSGETQSATVNVDDGSVPAFELNINAGGGDYTALDGTLFVADTQFFSGNAVTGGTPVAGTEDDVLFQSWRSGNFSYDITVANGLYAIELGFSEAFRSGAGERLFDVTIEDTVALDNFDIFATTGAQDTAYITPTILANVSDGTLNIDFEKVLRNPVVQSISVRSVTAEGAPPDAVDNGYTVDEDGTLVVDALTGLLANDSDPDGDTLTAELAVGPANGSVTVNADGSFSYIPDPDFAGSDSFTYTATDIAGFSDVATVNITVNPLNDTPTPSDDAVGTTGDPVLVDVLANDSDPDGDTLALVSFTQGADGTVTRDDNGTPADLTDDRLLYTPGAGFAGSDSFSYTVEDPSGETQSATVNVDAPDILGLPQPPAGIPGYYLETGGVVKVQFENIVGDADGWVFQDDTNGDNPGFEGTGYYYWKDELSNALTSVPDEGNFATTIYIQDSGRYKIFVRSARDNDDRLDAKNDMWVRVNGDTSSVQVVERELDIENGYAKIFGTSAGDWTYSEQWDDTDTDNNPGSVVRLEQGFNTFEFAGRSEGYHIDSFQLVEIGNGNDPDETFTSSPFLTGNDASRFTLDINAAGPAFTAADGTEFVADTFFTGGNTSNNGGDAIENTEDDVIYQTERFFPNDFSTGYSIPVENGTYSVSLGFAETFLNGPGQRVFDVLIEDSVALDDLDVFAEAGAADTAFTADPFTVNVLDGVLDISFVADVQNPIVNAISITDITSEDVAPIAVNDTADIGFATAGIVDVLANDVDFDDDAFQIVSVGSEATLGTVAIDDNGTPTDTADDFIVYTSNGSGAGADSFTYEIADSTGRISTGTVDVNVLPLDAVAFDTVTLNGVPNKSWTSLQFGPDDRLYASDRFGEIFAFEIEQVNDPITGKINGYNVIDTEVITAVLDIPNYNDDGTPAPEVTDRQVTGFAVTGTAANPVIYVGSSDPREGGGGGGGDGDVGLDTNSGVISRLDYDGTDWQKVDLVRGLPRSEENHSINGIILSTDPVTGNDILYVQQGGNTNSGAPSANFAFASETALSAAILKVDLTVLESGTGDYTVKTDGDQQYVYDLPTVLGDTVGIFGGRDGLNQARLVEGSPVTVHSSGWRNGYDLVETEAGDLFSIDNGANEGWGGLPNGEGTANVTDEQSAIDPDGFNSVNNLDHLQYIPGEGYYAGHPNPIRANPNGAGITVTDEFGNEVWVETPTGAWPPVDPAFSFPNDGDFLLPGVEDNALVTWEISTNGLDEYTASTFQGALTGSLITASFNSNIYSITVDPSKASATKEVLASNPLGIPLDVTSQGDNDIFAGTIWVGYVAGFNGSGGPEIEVLVPTTASGTANDFDGDGYLNDDEIANGTNEFNPSSTPADNDSDFVSDLNDDDDDNDLILDVADHFEWDFDNGKGLVVTDTTGFFNPLRNDDPGFGLGGLGFTGWMTNGVTNYLDTFDDSNLILGGTSGIFTILNTSSGDARGALNTQENGFQFGVDLQTTGTVLVKTDMANVFGSLIESQLSSGQAAGVFIGNGDQDNYVKLAISVDSNNDLGIVLLHEENGIVLQETFMSDVTLPIGAQVELFFEVDSTTGDVTPGWRIDGGAGETGPSVTVGGDILAAIQGTYQNEGVDSALAVGVIATSGPTGDDFAANYDVIDIFAGTLADEFSFV